MNIGFIGYDWEDLVIYTAKRLEQLGYRVELSDRTETGSLLRKWGQEQKKGSLLLGEETGRNIRILCLKPDAEVKELAECRVLFLVSDEQLYRARLLRETKREGTKRWLLIRNAVGVKYAPAYLAELAGIPEEQVLVIPWAERDIRQGCYLETDSSIPWKRLSAGLRRTLEQIQNCICAEAEEQDG